MYPMTSVHQMDGHAHTDIYGCKYDNIPEGIDLSDLVSDTFTESFDSADSNVQQLDGNVSVMESLDSSLIDPEIDSSSIPVIITSRSTSPYLSPRRHSFNKRIRKDNNVLEASSLPAFTVYNMRSLWSKINNLAEDIIERSVDISFLSEVWEQKENLKHQNRIEEMLELKGVSYISTPRPGNRRGGGTAIVACPEKFSIVKLHIEIPRSIEVVWGLLRPKKVMGKISKIILCSFYCPPRSKKKNELIDHISTVLNTLKVDHPNAATIIAGDKNDLDERRLLALDPALAQLVRKPTRKDKLLSIVITDLRRFYIEPRIIDPIPVDDPLIGVPSDHNGVLVLPLNNIVASKGTTKEIKLVRPMPDSAVLDYRRSVGNINWNIMIEGMSSSEMVDIFQKMITNLVDIHFPLKSITISQYDKPWFTQELRAMRRRRQRLYRKEGRSQAYLIVKQEFDKKLEKEAFKYIEKIKKEVTEGKRGSSYSSLRRLGDRNFEDTKGHVSFDIPEFVDKGFDDEHSAEAIADYFSSISQEFEPISVERFSPLIKEELERGRDTMEVPILLEHEVHDRILKAKKPHSMVPGDIKRTLVKECSVELTEPVAKIYNQITKSKEYPRAWVQEQQVVIPKKTPPSSLDDLRNISGTPFFSKQYESFLSDWLLPIVDPFLDAGQCGGLRKSSISHYLIKLLHFIQYNLDKPQPYAVLLACIDMSKAFNRMSHQRVIEDLHAMKVPGWLLLILISYLTDRKMVLKFRSVFSLLRCLPGSSPQGTVLGVILFIIIFNGACLRPSIPRPIWPFFNKANDPAAVKMKFVDDLSVAVRVNLETDLIEDMDRMKPLTFDERFQTKLSDDANLLQEMVDNLKIFSSERQMLVNTDKSSVMKFSTSRTKDFPAEISLDDKYFEVNQKMRILGVIVSSDLRWEDNTEHICKKAYKNMWVLRRMKSLQMDTFIIMDYYMKEVRVHLELAVPVWHSGLTLKLSADIERVQRIAVSILLGRYDFDYGRSCAMLGLKPLYIRREELCKRFAVKTTSSKCRHNDLFKIQTSGYNTRGQYYREHLCHTSRFYKSALPYLTRTLNQ